MSLKKAEDKILADNLFPFLVKDRLGYSKEILSAVELGPGKYMGNKQNSLNYNHSRSNTYNGSSAARFSDNMTKVPGPGSYQTN
jgi:hypothetical protein